MDVRHFHSGRYEEACDLVKRFHYSRRVPTNVQFVGTLHQDGGLFGDFGPAVAACFFSIPPTRWAEPVLELSRLVRSSDMTPLTPLIARCCDALKKAGHDLLVSFADKTHQHHGGVYQAASWHYAGARERSMDGVVVGSSFIPGRSCNQKWGTRSPEKLRNILRQDVQPHYDEGKHLYFRALGSRGKAKAARLGLVAMPYPKPHRMMQEAAE